MLRAGLPITGDEGAIPGGVVEDGYVVNRIDHVLAGAARRLSRLRKRSAPVDHLCRAVQR
jgi:hypothetical protein